MLAVCVTLLLKGVESLICLPSKMYHFAIEGPATKPPKDIKVEQRLKSNSGVRSISFWATTSPKPKRVAVVIDWVMMGCEFNTF